MTRKMFILALAMMMFFVPLVHLLGEEPQWFNEVKQLILEEIGKADAETYAFRDKVIKEWEPQIPDSISPTDKDHISQSLISITLRTQCLNNRIKHCVAALKNYFQQGGKGLPEDQSRFSQVMAWVLYSASKEGGNLAEAYTVILKELNSVIIIYETELKNADFYAQKNPLTFGVFVDRLNEMLSKLRMAKGKIENTIAFHKQCQEKFADQILTCQRLAILIHRTKFSIVDKLLALAEEAENTAKSLMAMNGLK
jgi:hypothetical protein